MHKEVIKEVTVGVSEEELSKVRARVGIDRCASWKLDAIEQTLEWGRSRADGICSPHRSTPRPSARRRRSASGF